MPRSTRPLQEHPEVLPAPPVDPQEWYLHLKRCKKEGVSIPHYSIACLTPKGLKGLLSSKNTKRTLQHHRNNSTVSIKPHSLIYIILYPISQYSTITWMHMNVWHTVIQCTIVLGLSPKDTRPHPNTLPIRSLPGVNFWVFHPRDLSPFLIRLTRASTSHLYFIHFSQFFFSSYNHNANECHKLQNFLIISTIPTFSITQ